MNKIIKYIWQLPQNLLGLLVILFSRAKKQDGYYLTRYYFGVSLGFYIILGGWFSDTTIKHEQGHQKQSLYLGPLYLLIIGLPSALGNIYSRIAHKDSEWYYNQPWEKGADRLGGVNRVYNK